jgi:putative membrane protein
MMGGNFGHGGFGFIGMILGLVIVLAVLVGITLLVIWLVRRSGGYNARVGLQDVSGQSARDIVQARYAKGEINREEYQQLMADLGK